jgi:hypothetical protein
MIARDGASGHNQIIDMLRQQRAQGNIVVPFQRRNLELRAFQVIIQ